MHQKSQNSRMFSSTNDSCYKVFYLNKRTAKIILGPMVAVPPATDFLLHVVSPAPLCHLATMWVLMFLTA